MGFLIKKPPQTAEKEGNPITAAEAEAIKAIGTGLSGGLGTADPVALAIREVLERARVSTSGLLVIRQKSFKWVCVSESTRGRAAHFLESLIRVCRSREYGVRIGDHLAIPTPAGEVEIEIGETYVQIEREPTKWEATQEASRLRRDSSAEPKKFYEWALSGRLSVRIVSPSLSGDRRTWNERAKLPLERQLVTIAVGIVRFAENRAKAVAKAERERLAAIERERIWVEERRLRELEEWRRRKLWDSVEQWERAERLRRFLRAAKDSGFRPPEDWRLGSDEWIDWLERYADLLDPTQGP